MSRTRTQSDRDMEFNKLEWMTGLGKNTTAAMYVDEDLDEAVFEPTMIDD